MGWLGQPDEPKPEPIPPPPLAEKWWEKPAKLYTKWRNKMSETKNSPVYAGVDLTALAEQPDALISHELSAPLRNIGEPTQQPQQELKRKGPKPGYIQAKIAAEAQRLLAEHQANGFDAVVSGNMQQPQQRPEQNIFLVDGTVNFVPSRPNIQPVTSQQTRIVWANNTDEAMDKYRSYFSSLNTAEATYVVAGMLVSEAIV